MLRRGAKTTPDGENMISGQRGKNTENSKFALCRCLVASAVINIPIFYKIQKASMSGEAPKDKGHH